MACGGVEEQVDTTRQFRNESWESGALSRDAAISKSRWLGGLGDLDPNP